MESLVQNAASTKQVKNSEKKKLSERDEELNDLRVVLQTEGGRRMIWRFIAHCRAFESIWEPSAKIHYNAGMQDVGHFLLAEVIAADEAALLTMMKEGKANV